MPHLSEIMQRRYADWQDDLPQGRGWRELFNGCPPPHFNAGADIKVEDECLIWPGRRGANLAGSPVGAHVCRAFQRTSVVNTRFIILGHDPYTDVSQATGRAFECLTPAGALPPSIIAPMLWALETQPAPGRLSAFSPGPARPTAIARWFDHMADMGVLWLNCAWTYSSPHHQARHQAVWRPVMSYLIQELRDRHPDIRFLTLGDAAREFAAGIPEGRKLHRIHPSDPKHRYNNEPNPFVQLNDELQWWPTATLEVAR